MLEAALNFDVIRIIIAAAGQHEPKVPSGPGNDAATVASRQQGGCGWREYRA